VQEVPSKGKDKVYKALRQPSIKAHEGSLMPVNKLMGDAIKSRGGDSRGNG
jgi:hypothetical protein